MSDTTYVSVE